MSFEGPFGISMGTLFLSGDRYVVYNSFENVAVRGSATGSSFRSVIPFDLTLDQIMGAFSGVLTIPFEEEDLVRYSIDDNRFLIQFVRDSITFRYWVDPTYVLVTRYEMADASGRVLMEANFSSFRDQDDLAAPRRISISLSEPRRRVSVGYTKLTLNDPNPSFAFSIPRNARTMDR